MSKGFTKEAFIVGVLLCIGLLGMGWLLGSSVIEFKSLDRVVTVKGLSEREVTADTAIWPIRFVGAHNNLSSLYETVEEKTTVVLKYLHDRGFADSAITVNAPSITDKHANAYGSSTKAQFRYTASQIVTVYSSDVAKVRAAQKDLIDLGKSGIAIAGGDYQSQTEYLFTGLNKLKPAMIEEATKKAREVAEKFAADSKSKLGKIKTARQGQFSISNRDSSTPHVKRVRVVSTITYYLSD